MTMLRRRPEANRRLLTMLRRRPEMNRRLLTMCAVVCLGLAALLAALVMSSAYWG
jgi:hypothetical protein